MLPFFILVDHEITPTDFETWALWTMVLENRVVEVTHVDGDEWVSTVFLPWPLLTGQGYFFETRVFGGRFHDLANHYQTWAEAEAGHKRIVNTVMYGVVD